MRTTFFSWLAHFGRMSLLSFVCRELALYATCFKLIALALALSLFGYKLQGVPLLFWWDGVLMFLSDWSFGCLRMVAVRVGGLILILV